MSQDVVRCYNCGTTRWGSRAKYIGTPDRSQKSLGIQSIFRMYDELLGGFKHCLFSIIWDNHPNWRTHIFQKGLKPPITELDDGNIYRKPLYLMVKNMVSCRFSLKPIHWSSRKNSQTPGQTLHVGPPSSMASMMACRDLNFVRISEAVMGQSPVSSWSWDGSDRKETCMDQGRDVVSCREFYRIL